MRWEDAPLMQALSSAAIPNSLECVPRHLGNTAWAFATLEIAHDPLRESLAAAAIAKSFEFNSQGVSNMAWSYAI